MSIGLPTQFYFSIDMQIEPLKALDKMKTVLLIDAHKSLSRSCIYVYKSVEVAPLKWNLL